MKFTAYLALALPLVVLTLLLVALIVPYGRRTAPRSHHVATVTLPGVTVVAAAADQVADANAANRDAFPGGGRDHSMSLLRMPYYSFSDRHHASSGH